MVFVTLPRLLLAVCFSILSWSRVVAQTVMPSNATTNTSMECALTTTLNQNSVTFPILPLTNHAAVFGDGSQSNPNERYGPLALIIPTTVNNFQPGDIAYVSCEPSDYSSGVISAGDTINLAVSNKPNAIVLYSVYAATCNFSALGDFQYSTIYTMQNASSSIALVDGLRKNNPPYPLTYIYPNETSSANAADNQSSSTGPTKKGNLITGLVFGVVTPITVMTLGLCYFCVMRRMPRRKQQFMRAKASGEKKHAEGINAQLYFQQKAELDDEQRRHEMDAMEVRYEMEGEDAIQQIATQQIAGEGRRERHFDRQEMRGEEHPKELDAL